MTWRVGSLKLGQSEGDERFFLVDRLISDGDPVQMRACGVWLTGRFEWDAVHGGPPAFGFSVELEGGVVAQRTVSIPEGALLRWPVDRDRTTANTNVRRGDLFWIEPDDAHVRHPHVVVSDDVFNRSRITSVIVCALTSNLGRQNEPGNVLLEVGEGGLSKQSVVVVSQVSSIDKLDLGDRIGALSSDRVEQIVAGLRFQQAAFFFDR